MPSLNPISFCSEYSLFLSVDTIFDLLYIPPAQLLNRANLSMTICRL